MSNIAAMKNGTLLHPDARAEILRRIEALTPESERRWGRMTAHQMVCHLSDACRAVSWSCLGGGARGRKDPDYTLKILPKANHAQWEAKVGSNAE